MKKTIIRLKNTLFIPICIIFVCYFLFYNKVEYNFFMSILSYIVLGLGVFLILGNIIELSDKKQVNYKEKTYLKRDIVNLIYFYSEYIINYRIEF